MPESARYLIACGRTKEAEKVLKDAAKQNNAIMPKGKLRPEPKVRKMRGTWRRNGVVSS